MSEPRRSRWRPTPLIAGSLALAGLAPLAVALAPSRWPWVVALLAADHLAMAAAGMAPRSGLLGPNLRRLPTTERRVALTFDDGPDPEGTPRVLELLERTGTTATFFAVGHRIERYPDLARQIVDRGHGLENHSWSHSHFFAFAGPRRLRSELARVQRLSAAVSATVPRWFRAPAGIRGPLLDPVLHHLGLRLASWSARGFDAVERDPDRVLERLRPALLPGAVILLHDGRTPHRERPEGPLPGGIAVLPRLLEELQDRGLEPVGLPTFDEKAEET